MTKKLKECSLKSEPIWSIIVICHELTHAVTIGCSCCSERMLTSFKNVIIWAGILYDYCHWVLQTNQQHIKSQHIKEIILEIIMFWSKSGLNQAFVQSVENEATSHNSVKTITSKNTMLDLLQV